MTSFSKLCNLFKTSNQLAQLTDRIVHKKNSKSYLEGLAGSSISLVINTVFNNSSQNHLVLLEDKKQAGHIYNDLQQIIGKENILFFPESYTVPYNTEDIKNANVLMRNEVMSQLNKTEKKIIVSYGKAIGEKTIGKKEFNSTIIILKKDQKKNYNELIKELEEVQFNSVNFVSQPGDFSIRGSIIDVFSYGNELPYRIQYQNNTIISIRSFKLDTQESLENLNHIEIVPFFRTSQNQNFYPIYDYMGGNLVFWVIDSALISSQTEALFNEAKKQFKTKEPSAINFSPPEKLYLSQKDFSQALETNHLIEFGVSTAIKESLFIKFNQVAQPVFNKNFKLLIADLIRLKKEDYQLIFFTENLKQSSQLEEIIKAEAKITLSPWSIFHPIHGGFIDHEKKLACYTYHEIFGKIQRYKLKDGYKKSELSITLKNLNSLNVGDYVTHINYGIGKFSGLQKIKNNGLLQEAIRLEYANNDLLYVNVHSLHKIAKYTGKEGSTPSIHKLGGEKWKKTKAKAKSKIKKIAFDLINLYAKRKASTGYQYLPDSYLQYELEASFLYEDTPDQVTASANVKKDMESPWPMDRLICGDVGFGKTEIAIRAAYKAVADSKQVVMLVPTTILALQHYKTFKNRINDLPCQIEYINRFKSQKQQKEILRKLAKGEIDIIIGTHRIIGKDVNFKDLGLLIIDEEHKFGVGIKDKLKTLKTNLDTLTLTATPIPRTLQFSLMGARDLSNITTPPPNRQPVKTKVITLNEELLRDAITQELSREGQVFFVNNRIEDNKTITGMIQRLCPDARVKSAHGQMNGNDLEQAMMSFVEGEFDVLVSTTIIESGLDIPNANTIIINNAHHFGLSDLHQMRGRVGRSNKKAFCYLISPSSDNLNQKQRKRLTTLVNFSDLGSGFNIALQDLDIRGCGNLLGGEQSGFMNDIGIETYQKILEQTINELKLTEFKDLYKTEDISYFITDCQIETDLLAHIPDSYIRPAKERLSVYKDINMLKDNTAIEHYKAHLIDRFGFIPDTTYTLFKIVELRLLGKSLGFEKITFTNQKLTVSFIASQEHEYFNSEIFTTILSKISMPNEYNYLLKETKFGLKIMIENISNITLAINCLSQLKKT